jgi:uncharacterized membrane protein
MELIAETVAVLATMYALWAKAPLARPAYIAAGLVVFTGLVALGVWIAGVSAYLLGDLFWLALGWRALRIAKAREARRARDTHERI